MRKRRILLIGIPVVVVAMVGLVMVLIREREPEYGGKKLSEWVRALPTAYGPTPPGVFPDPSAKAAEQITEAILQIGTNAIPHLLVWTQYEVPVWRTKIQNLRWLPEVLKRRVLRDDKLLLQKGANKAFHILGPSASGAMRTLNYIMNDPTREMKVAGYCAFALVDIGDEAVPALLGGLTNKHEVVQWIVANRLQFMVATDRLAWQPGRERTAANALVSSLVSLLHDPRQNVREAATNALRKIDPVALEKAKAQ